MKYLLIIFLFSLSFNLYGQTDYVYNYTDGRSDKVIYNIKAKEDSIKEIIKKYDKIIELNPKDEKVCFMKAENEESLAHLIDNYTDAIHAYANVIKLGSKYVDTSYYRLGRIRYYLAYGLLVRGRANDYRWGTYYDEFKKAIEVNPKYADAYYQVGVIEGSKENYKKAIEYFTKVIELNTGNYIGEAYYSRGSSKYNKKDKEGACVDWNKASELGITAAKQLIITNCTFTPKTAEDFYMRAQTKGRKQYKEAVDDYTKAIELNPNYKVAFLDRGSAKFALKDKTGACLDWQKAVELGSNVAKDYIKEYCK